MACLASASQPARNLARIAQAMHRSMQKAKSQKRNACALGAASADGAGLGVGVWMRVGFLMR